MSSTHGKGAPLPADESERIAALQAARLLDTPAEASFDELTALAADLCDAPIALVSLVDADRQWFKSCRGLDASETPREQSFCAHAILGEGVFEVNDASLDPRFADNPLVTGEPGIRFYAGVPVSAPDGHPIGTLCVIGRQPRTLDQRQRDQLSRLAALCTHLISERQARLEAEQGTRALKHLLDTQADGVVACDRHGRLSLFNRAAREWHGCDPMAIPQSEWASRFDLFEADGTTPLAVERIPLVRAHRGEQVVDEEFCIRAKDRALLRVVASGGPLRDSEGRIEGAQIVMHDITQRSVALESLREERTRLEMVLQGTRAGTWEWNVQTGETRFNQRWAEIVGYTLEELAPVSIQTWLGLAHPDDLPESGAQLEAHFRGESERYDYVCRMRHKLGHWIWVHDRGRVMSWTEDGKPLWMAGTHLEVTDLREAQRATESALAELQSIVEGARDVSIIGTETDGTIRLFNPGAERLLGYSAEELVGRHSPAVFHDLDEVEARGDQLSTQYGRDIRGFEVFVDAARRGEAETRRWTYVRKDGERRTVSLSVSAIRDGSNEITGFVGIAIDLTEMIRKQQALEETEHRFRGAFEASSLGLALVAPDGRFLQVNTALCRMLGYEEQALLAGDFQELTHPDDLATDLDLVRQTLAGKIPGYQLRKRYITREGATLWAMLAVSLLRDPEGRPRYFVSQILDITHRVRAEEALRASEAKLSELFRLSPVGIAINRMSDGQFIEANPEFFRLTGHTEERLKRIAYWDLTPFEYEPQEKLQFAKLDQEGRYGPYEKEYIRADGRRVPVLLNGVRFQPPGTSEPLILSVVQDISERKRIERMKSEFVSTVSHELRTPLTSISGALDLAVGGALGVLPDLAMEMLELAHRNARRLGALVGDLLDLEKLLAGKLSVSKSMQELQALMVDVVGSLAPYADRFGVTLRLADLPRITLHTDPERFTQILNNLLSNAIKFSAEHAEVEVQAAVHGHMVELQVLDRGCGVPESFRKHLFQSFAQADNSNERKSEGTGLGLSISRELATRLGGEIGYLPRAGGGSCFWVRLPISQDLPIALTHLGTPRVLIVEDDPDVAVVLGMLISREGFEPVYASDLAGARAQLGMYSVHAVTLDLGLGQERGEDLLRELRADPATVDLPVLIVSGKPTVLDAPGDRTGQIAKPLNPSALIAALRAIIADTSNPDIPQVLLVEDDPDHVQFVREAIGSSTALMCARSLSEASGMLSARKFDLVILDLGLPDGDGRTLLERMPQPSPPILILSQRELAPDATRPFAAALLKSSTDAPKLQRFIDMVLRASPRTASASTRDSQP